MCSLAMKSEQVVEFENWDSIETWNLDLGLCTLSSYLIVLLHKNN